MYDPIAVVTIENAVHYSQSSCENAIPSSGTSPLFSYKEVPPPPRHCGHQQMYRSIFGPPKFAGHCNLCVIHALINL